MSTHLPSSPTFHELLVKERLPRWLDDLKPRQLARLEHLDDPSAATWAAKLSTGQREALRQAQSRLRAATFALARATADLRTVPAFAGPLLMQRLHQRFGLEGELRSLNFVRFSRDWDWKYLATLLNHRVEPLLQAALQNFEKDPLMQPESVVIDGSFHLTKLNGYDRYNYLRLPFSAAQFAEQCHDLDLGKRYQAHLDAVFGRQQVRDLAIAARRAHFARDLLVARLRDPHADHDLLEPLLKQQAPTAQLRSGHFSLFGVDVLDAVLLQPAAGQAVFLYLPGLAQPLLRYASHAECQRGLLARLCDPGFRQRFYGFIQQDKAEHFASVLQRNLTGQTLAADREQHWTAPDDTDLHWVDTAIDSELFAYLQDRHHRRLRNEARLLAVPSAEVDEAARQRRLHYWESVGLDLLGVAAFFIPAAGVLMAVVFAAQVLGEVYEGVEAWEQGDIDAALAHAKAVAVDIGTAVATGAALNLAGKLGGKLIEVIRPDGTPRLWNGDLAPYRVPAPAAARRNALGLLESEGKHYLALDDGHFEVQAHEDGQRWRIRHPGDADAFQPLLEHNGEGAWHAAHEHPLEWPRQTLLRRLGNQVADYSDDELDIASRISGIDRDALLEVYLKHQPLPPRLLQTLQRLRAGTPAEDPLERLFDGIYTPARCIPASERLALLSLERQPGWPTGCTLELRAGDRSGPLLERAGERFASDVRMILKVPGGYRAVPGEQPQAVVEDLFDAIQASVPELMQAPRALKDTIVEQARLAPGHTRGLVWSGHSNGWRDEGRLLGGFDTPPVPRYPAPGPSLDPLRARYRRLYPGASNEQFSNALNAWNAASRPAHLELRALEQQLERLRTTLGQWAGDAPLRGVARDRLLHCWQRDQHNRVELDLGSIGLDEEDFTSMPHLADGFAHVEELHLGGNPLRSLPQLLINQLPGLHTLFASAMELRHVPSGLGANLRNLELTDNNIVWSSISQRALAEYPMLERLNLSGNPLTTPPDLTPTPNLIDVNLFDCSLRQVPEGLVSLADLEHMELASNQIERLPPGLEQNLSAGAQGALSLEHNPLDEDAETRIDAHYQATGIDLLVAEDDYTSLMLDADDATQACWERLSRLLPVEYRRDLRGLADQPTYRVAPVTTRRRFWFMLRWLESSPRARTSAQRIDASQLLDFEMLADLETPEPFATPRLKTEHYLRVAVDATRCAMLDEALLVRLPAVTATQLEALRALTLKRLGNDPHLRLRLAPTAQEPLNLDDVETQAQHLDAQWTSNLRQQLRMIDGNTEVGRDALLADQPNGEPALPFWVRHLEQRYHAQFEQLQEQANSQLLDAENRLSEGEYLIEANHLRRQLDRERQRLLNDLTRTIADGSQTQW